MSELHSCITIHSFIYSYSYTYVSIRMYSVHVHLYMYVAIDTKAPYTYVASYCTYTCCYKNLNDRAYACTYGKVQCQLDSCGQTTHAVWHFYLHPWVRVQAHMHATSYPLQVISTTDKSTSLSSSILHASHYTHTHFYMQVPVKYFTFFSTLHTNGRIHRIYWLTSLYFDRKIKVAGFRKEILPVAPF